jgi:hypothetical protein
VSVHEYLLAGWGMPIGESLPVPARVRSTRQRLTISTTGELFDLESLSKICFELNRYSFFITSMPLNMPGGVSSPPNAMAIF